MSLCPQGYGDSGSSGGGGGCGGGGGSGNYKDNGCGDMGGGCGDADSKGKGKGTAVMGAMRMAVKVAEMVCITLPEQRDAIKVLVRSIKKVQV
jgi:hypothetical protein